MTAETVYERHVARLEDQYRSQLETAARRGLQLAKQEGYADDRDYRRDAAVDEVEKFMFENVDFETVKATDISDIACEIGDRIEREEW